MVLDPRLSAQYDIWLGHNKKTLQNEFVAKGNDPQGEGFAVNFTKYCESQFKQKNREVINSLTSDSKEKAQTSETIVGKTELFVPNKEAPPTQPTLSICRAKTNGSWRVYGVMVDGVFSAGFTVESVDIEKEIEQREEGFVLLNKDSLVLLKDDLTDEILLAIPNMLNGAVHIKKEGDGFILSSGGYTLSLPLNLVCVVVNPFTYSSF